MSEKELLTRNTAYCIGAITIFAVVCYLVFVFGIPQ